MNRLFSFLICLFSISSFCMENLPAKVPLRVFPEIFISNNCTHAKVSGWVQRQPPMNANVRETFTLLPYSDINFPINRQYETRFLATIQVANDRYHLNIRDYSLALYVEGAPFFAHNKWHIISFLVQKIPIKDVAQFASLMIKKASRPILFVPNYTPQDGRPEVPLQVYKELTGHKAYTTPDCLLGLGEHYTQEHLNFAYKNFLVKWKEHYLASEHNADIFKLIVWAKSALEEQLNKAA